MFFLRMGRECRDMFLFPLCQRHGIDKQNLPRPVIRIPFLFIIPSISENSSFTARRKYMRFNAQRTSFAR